MNPAAAPTVSVVIPTRDRVELLPRSLGSVAAQTYRDFEVIVVVDGEDAGTARVLAEWGDTVTRVIVNPTPLGGSEARNIGVRAARGKRIAFLDDDDEWMPTKLERQLADLDAAEGGDVIALSQLVTRSPDGDYIGPKTAPGSAEPLSEYLFVRSGWFKGGGRVQTSTIMTSRDLLLRVPFDPLLVRYQETDWILRAAAAGARIVMTMEPLSIWYVEEARPTVTGSKAGDWRFSLAWIRERRDFMTPRAYSALMLIRVGGLAAAAGDVSGGWAAWREAWRYGRPSAREVAIFVGKWALPPSARRYLRSRLAADRSKREGRVPAR